MIIILPETNIQAAMVIAEKIRSNIENEPLGKHNNQELKCTVSIGLAAVRGSEKDLEELLKRADEMLYKAKKEGRNRIVSE